jgi:hypothetical protein
VEATVREAAKTDPCNARTRLLFARILEATARYATAKQQISLAHQFDPEDQEITLAWIRTLPMEQRINEMTEYVAAPNGNDQMTIGFLKGELERWRGEKDQPAHECKLVTGGPSAEIPFIRLAGYAGHTRAYGLEVSLNGVAERLQIDTRGQGITLYRPGLERANLKKVGNSIPPPGGMGKPTYTAVADTVKIGGLEFKDCAVNVVDGNTPFDDGVGFIGTDVFADFLVTVDYPMRTLGVAPLPLRPGTTAQPPALQTLAADFDPVGPAASLSDRYAPPELKDYVQFYRVGHDLLLPTAIAGEKTAQGAEIIKLFVPDDGAPDSSMDKGAAAEVTKVYEDNGREFGNQKVFMGTEVRFNFAKVLQKRMEMPIGDTSMASMMDGAEVSGFLGNKTLTLLTFHIDYRDGLLKVDYVPGRGYKFEDNDMPLNHN